MHVFYGGQQMRSWRHVLNYWGAILLLLLLSVRMAMAAPPPLLMLFVGSASQPPMEEAARLWHTKTGGELALNFGGSGAMLSEMQLSRRGDIYFPGSSDYLEKAKQRRLILPETERRIAYLVPALNVRKGNPKAVTTLADLARPGLRLLLADPEAVCVGLYAVEILEKNLTPAQIRKVRKNLVGYTPSCARTATNLVLGGADVVLGWRIFGYWNPGAISNVPLAASQIERIGYLPVAVSRFSQHPQEAKRFIRFLASREVQTIFRRHHYFTSVTEAAHWIGADKPVGGLYQLPDSWQIH